MNVVHVPQDRAASQANFTVRTMSRAELDLAINLAGREGWNPGLRDADAFYATDPNGFFVGILGDRPIGCISAVAYDATFGFMGLYLVRPESRGQGFGLQLWRAGMAYLGDRLIGLNGVVAQQENYEEAGFKPAFRNIRHEGAGGGQLPDGVIDLAGVPLDEVLAYDSALFPVPRPRFLRSWLKLPGSIGYGVAEGGRLAGFGVIRPCRIGYKIGPLFADTPEVADRLYRAGLACPGRSRLPRYAGGQPRRAGPGGAARHEAHVRNRPHVLGPRPRPAVAAHLRGHHAGAWVSPNTWKRNPARLSRGFALVRTRAAQPRIAGRLETGPTFEGCRLHGGEEEREDDTSRKRISFR